jgi:hypothetical protein
MRSGFSPCGNSRNCSTRWPLIWLAVARGRYAKLYYRQPAFILCTYMRSSARQLLQIYCDPWQIEVNHREEKDTLGIGQAQLWNPTAVPNTGTRCSRLSRLAAGRSQGVWSRTRPSLCPATETAPQRTASFLPRPHHAPPERSRRTPRSDR